MRKEAALWWEQAQRDLETARQTLRETTYYASAFFAQQAAEKGLKAVFIQRSKRLPPPIHNLIELGEMCQVPKRLKQPLVELNPDYLTTRYPDAANGIPAEAFTEKNASQHFQYAERVVKWCAKLLIPKPKSQPKRKNSPSQTKG